MIPIRSILATTDLTTAGERVLQTAAALARAFDARLHVVHVVPTSERRAGLEHEEALAAHVRRTLRSTAGPAPDLLDADVVDWAVVYDRPYHGILVHAAAVGADLIVLGRHRGRAVQARWAGTTAERVLRSADVPCLVVDRALPLPLRHVGVAVDLAPAARAGASLALDWLGQVGGRDAATTLSLVHVAAPTDALAATARLDAEVARIRPDKPMPDAPDVMGVLETGTDAGSVVARWTAEADVDLVVASSSGRRGWRRLWRGSDATTLTLRAACPVLLLPPAFWRRSPIPLERVGVAVGNEAAAERARTWVDRWGDADAAPTLLSLAPDGDLLRQARAEAVDLLVVHEARTEPYAPMPRALGALLEHTPIPVLVLRDLPATPLRHILVAVDTGDIWYEKLGWARVLAESSGADITVYHAIDLSLSSRVRREPGGELVPASSVWLHDGVERKVMPAMRTWLAERARMAGLPMDRVTIKVGLQDPWFSIPALARRIEADLVVVAAHAEGRPGRTPLSRVARATLERGTYSTLVVVDRAKREAEWDVPEPESAADRPSPERSRRPAAD